MGFFVVAMNRKHIFVALLLLIFLTVHKEKTLAGSEFKERGEPQTSAQVAKHPTTTIFSCLLNVILAIRQNEVVPVEPKYALIFSVGAGGKIVDAESGFECASQCEIQLSDVLRATYEVVPDKSYQFAGWSGDICNTSSTYDNPRCDVSVN